MAEINVTILEPSIGPNGLVHSLTLPIELLPNIGDELLLATEELPLLQLRIAGKKISILKENKYHVSYTAERI